MLDHISSVMNHAASGELEVLLTRIYHTDIPSPGRVLTFDNGVSFIVLYFFSYYLFMIVFIESSFELQSAQVQQTSFSRGR